ncbi:hypothetical protein AVEN_123495-1 [Araneus ventricosus]|uniref:Uncharacterized protein n=1 Tax=Araneus ventricosus TaxID=182803 RepID=A0A4Y2VNT6_ARAVE|nr:hypothetical protein AVEN_123495-1 [Araneus ventricosus]
MRCTSNGYPPTWIFMETRKNKDLKTWRVPSSHDWYKRSSPGGSIGLACDRADQTVLSRFVSGHLRSCSFSHGNKVFPVCAKCGVASASPEHILSCLRLSRETFEMDPLLALDFLRKKAGVVMGSQWSRGRTSASGLEGLRPDSTKNSLCVEAASNPPGEHQIFRGSKAFLLVWCGNLERGQPQMSSSPPDQSSKL